MSAGTSVPGHQCKVSRLAGRTRAHGTPARTTVTCPCGKRWQITKKHHNQGRVCGCGWRLLNPEAKEQAA